MDSKHEPYKNLLGAIFANNENLLPLRSSDIELIDQVLNESGLSERELRILKMRSGLLGDGSVPSFKKIGAMIGKVKNSDVPIVPQGARQIHEKALRIMRHPRNAKKLRWLFRDEYEISAQMTRGLSERVKRIEVLLASQLPRPSEKDFATTIDALDLSVRSYNLLKNAGVKDVRELAEWSESRLRGLRNSGEKSIKEIAAKLLSFGLLLKSDDF